MGVIYPQRHGAVMSAEPNTQTSHLRLLVFGAGAIGAYIGGSLALQGHIAVFVERPEVAAELRQRGLFVERAGKREHISNPHITGSLDDALVNGPFDIALFALKSYDTLSALENLRPYRADLPSVLCLQNGVENETALAELLGVEKVVSASVTTAVGRRAAGDIFVERLRGIGIGSGHPLSPILVSAFNQAGLNAQLYARPLDMKWSKMLTNLIANATSAILDMPPADIFANPALYRLEIAQLRETLAVMDALHIHAVDLPATPVRLLAFAVQFMPLWLSRPFLARAAGGGRGSKMPSFHIDLHSGRGKSEVDYLNGAVVRHAAPFGISTPVNRLLNDTLLALTNGDIPLSAFAHQPEKLLAPVSEPPLSRSDPE